MSRLKKNILTTIKIIFATGLIFYLVLSGSLNLRSMQKAMTAHPWWFLLAAVMMGLIAVIASFRWHLLLCAQGVTITFWKTLGLNFIGMFFNICLPGATGGDLAKCYYVASMYPDKKTPTIATVLIDRFLGLSGLVLVGGMAVLANPSISLGGGGIVRTVSCSILVVSAGLIIGVILFLNYPVSFVEIYSKKISPLPGGEIFLKFYRAVRVYRDKQSLIYVSLLLSILVHSTVISLSFMIGKIIGSTLSWRFYGVLTPLGLLANALPIAPSGLGVGEAAFEYLYHQVGSSFGGEIIALLHLISIFWGLAGLPFYLLIKKVPSPEAEKSCAIEWKAFYEEE